MAVNGMQKRRGEAAGLVMIQQRPGAGWERASCVIKGELLKVLQGRFRSYYSSVIAMAIPIHQSVKCEKSVSVHRLLLLHEPIQVLGCSWLNSDQSGHLFS